MKKLISLILIAASLFSLAACTSASELGLPALPEVSEKVPAPTPDANASPEPVEEAVVSSESEDDFSRIIVSIDNTEPEYIFDPDTTDDIDNLILSYLAEKPVVFIEGNSEASEKINDFFNCMDEEIATGDYYGVGLSDYPGKSVITDLAYDNYQIHVDYALDNSLEFAFSHTVEVKRCDSSVISFLFTDYVFKGEGAGSYNKYAVSFSTDSGEQLGIDYFKSVDSVKDLLNEKFSALAQENEEYSALIKSNSYENIVNAMIELGSWYIGNESVCFISSTEGYEDVDSKILEIEIPFESIKDIVSAVYPVKDKAEAGSVNISEDDEFGKTVADMISFSDEGETIFLNIEGTVYDIRVSLVQYSDADEKFFTKSVYWACNFFSDCLLQISADIPDGMPNIRIDYTADGESKSLLLSQSGYDGKPILVDSSIIAVG